MSLTSPDQQAIFIKNFDINLNKSRNYVHMDQTQTEDVIIDSTKVQFFSISQNIHNGFDQTETDTLLFDLE